MTVTAQYAVEHFHELAANVFAGSAVYIENADGTLLQLLSADRQASDVNLANITEDEDRELAARQPRTLGTGEDLVGPDFLQRWEEIERDWDENVIPKLWMNRDDERTA